MVDPLPTPPVADPVPTPPVIESAPSTVRGTPASEPTSQQLRLPTTPTARRSPTSQLGGTSGTVGATPSNSRSSTPAGSVVVTPGRDLPPPPRLFDPRPSPPRIRSPLRAPSPVRPPSPSAPIRAATSGNVGLGLVDYASSAEEEEVEKEKETSERRGKSPKRTQVEVVEDATTPTRTPPETAAQRPPESAAQRPLEEAQFFAEVVRQEDAAIAASAAGRRDVADLETLHERIVAALENEGRRNDVDRFGYFMKYVDNLRHDVAKYHQILERYRSLSDELANVEDDAIDPILAKPTEDMERFINYVRRQEKLGKQKKHDKPEDVSPAKAKQMNEKKKKKRQSTEPQAGSSRPDTSVPLVRKKTSSKGRPAEGAKKRKNATEPTAPIKKVRKPKKPKKRSADARPGVYTWRRCTVMVPSGDDAPALQCPFVEKLESGNIHRHTRINHRPDGYWTPQTKLEEGTEEEFLRQEAHATVVLARRAAERRQVRMKEKRRIPGVDDDEDAAEEENMEEPWDGRTPADGEDDDDDDDAEEYEDEEDDDAADE